MQMFFRDYLYNRCKLSSLLLNLVCLWHACMSHTKLQSPPSIIRTVVLRGMRASS